MNLIFIPSLIEFWITMITGLLVYAVTYLTTHHALFNIMQIEMFNRKPFSCWLCSNTWLGLFIFINLAYIFNPFYLLWGIIVIFLTGYAIVRG